MTASRLTSNTLLIALAGTAAALGLGALATHRPAAAQAGLCPATMAA